MDGTVVLQRPRRVRCVVVLGLVQALPVFGEQEPRERPERVQRLGDVSELAPDPRGEVARSLAADPNSTTRRRPGICAAVSESSTRLP